MRAATFVGTRWRPTWPKRCGRPTQGPSATPRRAPRHSLVVVELAARVLRKGGAAKAEVKLVSKDRWELTGTDRQRFSSGAAVSNVRRALAALRSSRVLDQKMRLRCAVPASAVAAGDAEALRRVVRVAPTRRPGCRRTGLLGLGRRGAARLAAAVVASSKTAVAGPGRAAAAAATAAAPRHAAFISTATSTAAAAPRAQSHTPARRAALDLPVRARPRGRDARAAPSEVGGECDVRAAPRCDAFTRDAARRRKRALALTGNVAELKAFLRRRDLEKRRGRSQPAPAPSAARSRSGPRPPKHRRSSDERRGHR